MKLSFKMQERMQIRYAAAVVKELQVPEIASTTEREIGKMRAEGEGQE